jgi:NAD(P)-dependent dehydrogenase (short-subunit alcohol dehydrogenase family)
VPLLKDKITVLTGGRSGIGLATAKRFVEEGACVFIVGRRQAELDKAVTEIGKNVTRVKTDISKLNDLDRFYETVAKKGRIDVIFAGAAFVEKTMTAAATPEHFDMTFNTNARGTYFTVQKGAALLERWCFHHPSGFRREEQRPSGPQHLQRYQGSAPIICPDVDQRTQGPENQDQRAEPGPGRHADVRRAVPVHAGRRRGQKQITSMIPLARSGLLEEVASAALFLASDLSSYGAGIDLLVDGGLTAVLPEALKRCVSHATTRLTYGFRPRTFRSVRFRRPHPRGWPC